MTVGDSPILDIIEEIASMEDCDYDDLPPLYKTVDIEAVTKLVEADDVRIEFKYCGYNVILENQEVTINEIK